MQEKPSFSIVIPAWNSESQLKKNLPAVFAAAARVDAQVIVVDDHSMLDNTVAYLESLGCRLTLIQNRVNLGFAGAVNVGVAEARGDIVILLNTDVRPSPDSFTHLSQHFRDPKLFAVTFNSDSSWARGAWQDGLFHHFRQQSNKAEQSKLPASIFASGGQAAFDRHKWVELGGMDRLYAPFYWEDVDLGYRAWKRGWHIVFDQAVSVVHDHQISVIRHNFDKQHIQNIAQRNQLLFIWKNITDRDLIISHLKHLPHFIKNYPLAFFAALTRLPSALRSRRIEQRALLRTDREVLKVWN